jgi:lysyl-tRNA synthetase class 2
MTDSDNTDDSGEQVEVRRAKLTKLRDAGTNPYPNDFKPSHAIVEAMALAADVSDEDLHGTHRVVVIAGRIMAIRRMGKASFFHIQDRRGKLQIYARKDRLGDDGYELFQSLDIGDIVGIRGYLFAPRPRN